MINNLDFLNTQIPRIHLDLLNQNLYFLKTLSHALTGVAQVAGPCLAAS